jgi:acyl-CoA thioester hydrolase
MIAKKTSSLTLRIDWSELDLFGHVNNVAYFKYVQASRVHFWEQLGMDVTQFPNPVGVMLASCNCSFIKPLFYPGEVTITVSVEFMKNTSFGFHHQVWNDRQELVAEAHDVMVMFDFAKQEKVPVPDELRKKMSNE